MHTHARGWNAIIQALTFAGPIASEALRSMLFTSTQCLWCHGQRHTVHYHVEMGQPPCGWEINMGIDENQPLPELLFAQALDAWKGSPIITCFVQHIVNGPWCDR